MAQHPEKGFAKQPETGLDHSIYLHSIDILDNIQ